jgi:hypothetical protein
MRKTTNFYVLFEEIQPLERSLSKHEVHLNYFQVDGMAFILRVEALPLERSLSKHEVHLNYFQVEGMAFILRAEVLHTQN